MGQPFEMVRDNADIFRYKQKVEMILNNIDKLEFEEQFKGHKYIILAKAEENHSSNENTLEDDIKHIRVKVNQI
jgi:uncharacterized protein YktA (UPF0223 family)